MLTTTITLLVTLLATNTTQNNNLHNFQNGGKVIHVFDSHKGWNIQQNMYWLRVEPTAKMA